MSTDVQPGSRTAPLSEALEAAVATVRRNTEPFARWYPDDCTTDGTYRPRTPRDGQPQEGANTGWTTSFWPGMLWLAHGVTGDDVFARAGREQVLSFARRVEDGVGLDTHDLGFLYTLSCVAPWRLTGDETARRAALLAADHLMARFLEPAGIIQAWGDLADPAQRGRTIIDSLMNMPLLHWASEQTGDARYADAARRHTAQLREHIVRADDSTFHTFWWDPTTGEPLRGTTQQGFSDSSCWARGQAWGIYGFAMAHRYGGPAEDLATAQRCADRFLLDLPDDLVAHWDLVFGDDSGQPRDSSAAAIAVCGLLELAGELTRAGGADEDAERYTRTAEAVLHSLAERYVPPQGSTSNALLLHAVYDMKTDAGVDEGCLWGDYFYLEALVRTLDPQWRSPW